jgi:hypothetical protein
MPEISRICLRRSGIRANDDVRSCGQDTQALMCEGAQPPLRAVADHR